MRVSAKLAAIELDGDTVRVAVVKTGGRVPAVLELHVENAVYQLPEERVDALAGAARAIIDRLKNRPAAYVLSMSCEWTITRLLTLPVTGAKRVQAAVPFELEPYLALPIDELVVDHVPVRSGGGQTTVLAVGLRRTTLAENLGILEAADVDVDGAGVDAVGLAALWMGVHPKGRGLRAALHVRPQNSILTVMRDKSLVHFRLLAAGSAYVQENPKAAARDVVNSLRAFQSTWNRELDDADREEVAELSVTGIQLFEDERALFETEVGLPVQWEDLLRGAKGYAKALAKTGADPETTPSNAWATVVGVAAAAAGEPYALDFRKDEFHRAAPLRSLRAQLVFTATLALVLLGGFGVYSYATYSRNIAEARRLGDAIWAEYEATFPEAAKATPRNENDLGGAQTYQRMKQERDAWYEQRGTVTAEMFNKPTMLDVLMELSKALPGDKVDLQEVRVTPGRKSTDPAVISMRGEASQASAVDDMEAALRASPIIKMRPNSLSRSSQGDKERFQVSADI